jgi:DNA recombination protein RmuC
VEPTTLAALLVAAAVLVAAGTLVGIAAARRRTPDGIPLLRELLDANRAVLEQERLRGTEELDGKKALIDQQLGRLAEQLGGLDALVRGLESDRQRTLGELGNELRRQHDAVHALSQTTHQLREALASSKVRGQWGERMAEDVLRTAGLLEGVNYHKQRTLGDGGRPDYTFLLPNGLMMHMDVKFPLDNYVRFLEAGSDVEARQHRDQFLRDVRDRVRELARRGYLDDDGAVDCLVLFIPNEQVYAFVHEHDATIAEEALRHRIVLCSPLTLYAVLAVVRQAVEHFRLEQTSREIIGLLGDFSKQWSAYAAQLDKVQGRFDSVAKEYDALVGTRRRALEKPLERIRALREDGPGADLVLVDDPVVTRLARDA